jgi:predicted acylesterase/phospholipase RssA
MLRPILLAAATLIGLSACTHTPPLTVEGEQCNIVRYALESPLPDERPLESILGPGSGDMLLLSGGSQNGAFGAGFLEGWHSTGQMPEFQLVTGISTGALQATGAFIGRPDLTVQGYTIDSEADLLDAYIDGSDLEGGLSLGAAITAIRRGAISDLVPLRSRLDMLFTPDVLEAVAARYDPSTDGAYLLAGATDVDLGQAVAFDMTELASRYASAPAGGEERRRLKDCYIEALIASSIVPPAARPVFIDNRMYIDGGVRNAVFDDRIGGMFADRPLPLPTLADPVPAPLPPPPPRPPGLYIILNGSGDTRAECGKVDPADCVPISSTSGQLQDWDIISLAFRTVDLLVNQVSRLSIERASQRAEDISLQNYFARIRSEDMEDPARAFTIPDFAGSRTCFGWLDEDIAQENPLEFNRRYMRCLIEYGRERGVAQDWDFAPDL